VWHHARHLPESRKQGVNFAVSLSVWDYLFGTAYLPHDGRDLALGFDNDESFPKDLGLQLRYPWQQKKDAGLPR
jgi:sterol desaturase/sphingolipid hydroxylase (fatty acid hydroxylase superfamily)